MSAQEVLAVIGSLGSVLAVIMLVAVLFRAYERIKDLENGLASLSHRQAMDEQRLRNCHYRIDSQVTHLQGDVHVLKAKARE